jgi:hypothetical protein
MAFEYFFTVDNDDDKGVPFGPVQKENMDVARFIIDFSCWLDPNETISKLEHQMIIRDRPGRAVPPWQADYPLDETSATEDIVNRYPLRFVDTRIGNGATSIILEVIAGTPQLSYVVSFVATAGISRRRREVDILVAIDKPFNPFMVSPGDVAPDTPTEPLIITESTALPLGFCGSVYLNNTTGAPVTVTLPPSPNLACKVTIIDVGYTNSAYPLTILADPSAPGINDPNVGGWYSDIMGDNISFEWSGFYWMPGTNFVPYLGEASPLDPDNLTTFKARVRRARGAKNV